MLNSRKQPPKIKGGILVNQGPSPEGPMSTLLVSTGLIDFFLGTPSSKSGTFDTRNALAKLPPVMRNLKFTSYSSCPTSFDGTRLHQVIYGTVMRKASLWDETRFVG